MYRLTADICHKVESGQSLKKLLYGLESDKYREDLPAIRSLTDKTLRNRVTIDELINQTDLAKDICFKEVWIARVLVCELVFGKRHYKCFDEITKKVYQYKKELKKLSKEKTAREQPFVPRYCRINTLTCTKSQFYISMASKYVLKEVGGKSEITYENFLKVVRNLKKNEYIQDYHMADLFIFHPKANLTNSELYQENKIILQDKASCLVAPLLAPTPGSIMLDMCAAPGFKTQHLSSISGTSGLILAIDISKDRYETLAKTRILYDLSNVMTFNGDSLHLPEMATKCIEYILLDAPCSGSGVVQNYDYGTDNRHEQNRLSSLHNLQCYLLRTALTKYTSARRIVYSTCSINEEENESVVEEILDIAQQNNFILANLKNHLQDFTTGLDKYTCGTSCIRLQPEQSYTNGFFIALFERTNPINPTPRTEFYNNLNEIIAGISCRKKRKAEEAELGNLENTVPNKSSVEEQGVKRIGVKKFASIVSPTSKSYDEINVGENENTANGLKNFIPDENDEEQSGDDNNSDHQEEFVEKSPVNPENNYIRVIRSPLFGNSIPPPKHDEKTETKDDSEDDSSENSADETEKTVTQTPTKFNTKCSPNKVSSIGEDSRNINIIKEKTPSCSSSSSSEEEEEEKECEEKDEIKIKQNEIKKTYLKSNNYEEESYQNKNPWNANNEGRRYSDRCDNSNNFDNDYSFTKEENEFDINRYHKNFQNRSNRRDNFRGNNRGRGNFREKRGNNRGRVSGYNNRSWVRSGKQNKYQ